MSQIAIELFVYCFVCFVSGGGGLFVNYEYLLNYFLALEIGGPFNVLLIFFIDLYRAEGVSRST